LAIGQPDLVSSIANNGYTTVPPTLPTRDSVLCKDTNGTDVNSNPT